ncbi:MAG: hypothetical protein ACJ746_25055 [Bryobacteraceae bacterium]
MGLAQRCSAIKLQIECRNTKQAAHANAEGFRERTTAFWQIRTSILADLALVEVLSRHGFKLNKAPSVTTAKSARQTYLAALASKPKESGQEQSQFRRAVQKIANDLRSSVQERLTSIERELPSSDEAFLRQVELLPQYKTTVEEIRRRRQELLGGRSIKERGPDELDSLLSKREQLRELADSLNPSEFPPAVLEFYRWARRKEGAKLEALTPEVREWLSSRNLLQSVRLYVQD